MAMIWHPENHDVGVGIAGTPLAMNLTRRIQCDVPRKTPSSRLSSLSTTRERNFQLLRLDRIT